MDNGEMKKSTTEQEIVWDMHQLNVNCDNESESKLWTRPSSKNEDDTEVETKLTKAFTYKVYCS